MDYAAFRKACDSIKHLPYSLHYSSRLYVVTKDSDPLDQGSYTVGFSFRFGSHKKPLYVSNDLEEALSKAIEFSVDVQIGI